MIVGSLLENNTEEKRIVFSLDSIKKYTKNGIRILLPKGYGISSNISDKAIQESGAILEDKDKIVSEVDILIKISLEQNDPIDKLKNEATIVATNFDKNKEDLIKITKEKKNKFILFKFFAKNNKGAINGCFVFPS